MTDIKKSGYGSIFDAEFMGGPFDGLKDSIINLNAMYPPKYAYKKMNKKTPNNTSFESDEDLIRNKLVEHLEEKNIPDSTKIAVYTLRIDEDMHFTTFDGEIEFEEIEDEEEEEEIYLYDFLHISNFKEYKKLKQM